MILRHTQELMQRKLEQQAFDTYAVLVHAGEQEKMFFSCNADGDTLFDIASCGKILHTSPLILQAAEQGVKLLVLPELGLTGYTCGDLFYQRTLLDGAEKELAKLLEATKEQEIVFLVGMPVRMGGLLFNCAVVCQNGEILGVVPKTNLIFEEKRWFAAAPA